MSPGTPPLARRLLAELMGSAFLAALVIGSGIAAQTLSRGDGGLQLFENAAATAAGLFAILVMLGPVSGGHLNPAVSLADASFGGIAWRDALAYIPAQIAGCTLGAIVANGMFSLSAVSISTRHRASPAHLLGEVIATAGLLLVIFSLARTRRTSMAPAAVGAYIGAAYFFTSSASFANPAISIGRMFSNTFAGIAPASVPAYIVAELVGMICAVAAIRVLYPGVTPAEAADVVLPHAQTVPAHRATLHAGGSRSPERSARERPVGVLGDGTARVGTATVRAPRRRGHRHVEATAIIGLRAPDDHEQRSAMEASSEYPGIATGEGYAVGHIDDLGDGPGFRKVRRALGVTAFGVNVIVMPPGIESGAHYHDEQEELYFLHRGTIEIEFGDGSVHRLHEGGLARVDAATVRRLRNVGDVDAVYLCAGGKDGYVGRDGHAPPGEEERVRALHDVSGGPPGHAPAA